MKWFSQLSASEQRLIKLGLPLVLLAVFWAFVYQPISRALIAKKKHQTTLYQQWNDMKKSENILQSSVAQSKKNQRDLSQPFIAWIDEQLLKQQLSQFVTRAEPKDNKTLILSFESVEFDKLIAWIEPLVENYNVTIPEADISLVDRSSGLCHARITLEQN